LEPVPSAPARGGGEIAGPVVTIGTPPAPASATSEPSARRGPERGQSAYVVRAGDSLWTIATSLLGADASPSAVAREVQRLWALNADRIGGGDPDLIFPGERLRLR
jgi:nucleoid-associated protein YgaU